MSPFSGGGDWWQAGHTSAVKTGGGTQAGREAGRASAAKRGAGREAGLRRDARRDVGGTRKYRKNWRRDVTPHLAFKIIKGERGGVGSRGFRAAGRWTDERGAL